MELIALTAHYMGRCISLQQMHAVEDLLMHIQIDGSLYCCEIAVRLFKSGRE